MSKVEFDGPSISLLPGCILTEDSFEVDRYIRQAGNGHQKVEIAETGLVIVHSDHQVNSPPIFHPRGSMAQYYVERYDGNNKVFCHFLNPNEETSVHSHPTDPPLSEIHCVIGTQHTYREDIGWTKQRGTTENPAIMRIPAGIAHFSMTREKWAVTSIVLINAKLYPEDQQHIDVADPEKFKADAKKLLNVL